MKSHANLWPRVTSFENLYRAFRRARRGKRLREGVARFEFDLERNLFELQRDLLAETYRPAVYHNFTVLEPSDETGLMRTWPAWACRGRRSNDIHGQGSGLALDDVDPRDADAVLTWLEDVYFEHVTDVTGDLRPRGQDEPADLMFEGGP